MAVQMEILGILPAYAFAGSASIGYLFLRSGWPKVRSIDTSYKVGWAVLIGAGFSIAVSAVSFAAEFAGAKETFIPVLAAAAIGTHAFLSLRRKVVGPKKVDVVVTKKAFGSELIASPLTEEKRSRLERFLDKKKEREEKAVQSIAAEKMLKAKPQEKTGTLKTQMPTANTTLTAAAVQAEGLSVSDTPQRAPAGRSAKSASQVAREKILAAQPAEVQGAKQKETGGESLADSLRKSISAVFAKKPKPAMVEAPAREKIETEKPEQPETAKAEERKAEQKKPFLFGTGKPEQKVDVKALDREWEKLKPKDGGKPAAKLGGGEPQKELSALKKIIAEPRQESVKARLEERKKTEAEKAGQEKAAQAKETQSKAAPALQTADRSATREQARDERQGKPLFGLFFGKPSESQTAEKAAQPETVSGSVQTRVDSRSDREKKEEIRRIIEAMKTLKGGQAAPKGREPAMGQTAKEEFVPRRLRRRHETMQGAGARFSGSGPEEKEMEEDLEGQMGVEDRAEADRRENDIESQIIKNEAKSQIQRFREKANREPTRKELDEIAENVYSQLEKSRLRNEPEEGEAQITGKAVAAEKSGGFMTRRQRALTRQKEEDEQDSEKEGAENAELPEEDESGSGDAEEVLEIPEAESSESIGIEGNEGKPVDEFDLSELNLGKDEELRISELDEGTGFKKTVETDKNTCPNCKSKTEELVFCSGCGTAYCPHCAKKMEKQPDGMVKYTCPQCGTEVRARA
ncbi:MAG: hypothetical protein HY394_01565 [Candidatus Diapherotrites archaeon]|nr:hypothetical protein [Candidatus Diapherotrites archaeon]